MAITKLTTLSVKANFNFTFEKWRREYHPSCWFGGICYQVILMYKIFLNQRCLSALVAALLPVHFLLTFCNWVNQLLFFSGVTWTGWRCLTAIQPVGGWIVPTLQKQEQKSLQLQQLRIKDQCIWEVLKSLKYRVGFFAVVVLSDCCILGGVFCFKRKNYFWRNHQHNHLTLGEDFRLWVPVK